MIQENISSGAVAPAVDQVVDDAAVVTTTQPPPPPRPTNKDEGGKKYKDKNDEVEKTLIKNPGLELDSSLPDPLRYSGANFIGLDDIIPATEWKSSNKDDAFKFDLKKRLDGALVPPDDQGSFSIKGTSSPSGSSGYVDLVSWKTDYQVKLNFVQTGGVGLPPNVVVTPLYKLFININGVGTSDFGAVAKETGAQGFEFFEIAAASDKSYELKDLVDVGEKIADVDVYMQLALPPAGGGDTDAVDEDEVGAGTRTTSDTDTGLLRPDTTDTGDIGGLPTDTSTSSKLASKTFYDILFTKTKLESIEVAKKGRDGVFGTFTKIQVNATFYDLLKKGIAPPVEDPNAESPEIDPSPVALADTSTSIDTGLPDTTEVANLGDEFALYQKTFASSNFEVTLEGFEIIPGDAATAKESPRGVPPKFGLMVREAASATLEQDKKYFCLFFEATKLDDASSYKVYTGVKGGNNENDDGFVIKSIQNTDVLKITRENGVCKGYYNKKLIGEMKFESDVDTKNVEALTLARKKTKDEAEAANVAAGTVAIQVDKKVANTTIKKLVNSFEIGIAYFAPPTVKYGDKKFLTSSIVKFSKAPSISLNDRRLSVVELYNLSLHYGRYGYGRTINTFTLLPGESTEIEIKSSTQSKTSSEKKTTVFDKVNDSSKSELQDSIETENSKSSEETDTKSVSGTIGASYGPVSASVTAGVSSSSGRQEMARSVASAVSTQASEYSSERSVEANTTTSTEDLNNTSNAVKRKLENLNNNRTLNFVFRQLNQEFVSVLHMVDIRIGFFGADDSYTDGDLSGLQSFIERYVRANKADDVYAAIIKKIRFVDNYEDKRVDVLIMKEAVPVDKPFKTINLEDGCEGKSSKDNDYGSPEESSIVFDKRLKETYYITKDIPIPDIEGVIIRADKYVLRTDGIVTEAIVGEGDALDEYGRDLQGEDIKEKQANTRILEAKGDLLLLQKEIMNATDDECVRVKYLQALNFLEPKKDGAARGGNMDSLNWCWCSKSWTPYGLKVALALLFMLVVSIFFSNMIALLRH